jgi:hypothetical protein
LGGRLSGVRDRRRARCRGSRGGQSDDAGVWLSPGHWLRRRRALPKGCRCRWRPQRALLRLLRGVGVLPPGAARRMEDRGGPRGGGRAISWAQPASPAPMGTCYAATVSSTTGPRGVAAGLGRALCTIAVTRAGYSARKRGDAPRPRPPSPILDWWARPGGARLLAPTVGPPPSTLQAWVTSRTCRRARAERRGVQVGSGTRPRGQ